MSNQNPMIVETALIEHLSNSIASVQAVGSLATYEWYVANEDMPPLPSLFVFPDDEAKVVDSGQGFDIESQTYVVSIIVSHVPSRDYTNTAAIAAGEIMAEVADSLIGWRPEYQGSRLPGFMPVHYDGRSSPNFNPGFAEFPVLYKTGMVLTGS